MAGDLTDRSPVMKEERPRRWSQRIALVATVLILTVGYGLAKRLAGTPSNISDRRHFSVDVNSGETHHERPVIAIRGGTPVHIDVHSKEAGVLMVHEIP